jgi:hypothetical protein
LALAVSVSIRNGKITPLNTETNPLATLVIGWRAKADEAAQSVETPYALARAVAFRDCANDLERVLTSVRAIIRA